MGEGERPDITNIVFGTVNDFDSIETPASMTLEFVPKSKYDELEEKYNELKKSHEELNKEKEFFKTRAYASEYQSKDQVKTIRNFETTIMTLVKLLAIKDVKPCE